jgi:hypothetical protein
MIEPLQDDAPLSAHVDQFRRMVRLESAYFRAMCELTKDFPREEEDVDAVQELRKRFLDTDLERMLYQMINVRDARAVFVAQMPKPLGDRAEMIAERVLRWCADGMSLLVRKTDDLPTISVDEIVTRPPSQKAVDEWFGDGGTLLAEMASLENLATGLIPPAENDDRLWKNMRWITANSEVNSDDVKTARRRGKHIRKRGKSVQPEYFLPDIIDVFPKKALKLVTHVNKIETPKR